MVALGVPVLLAITVQVVRGAAQVLDVPSGSAAWRGLQLLAITGVPWKTGLMTILSDTVAGELVYSQRYTIDSTSMLSSGFLVMVSASKMRR